MRKYHEFMSGLSSEDLYEGFLANGVFLDHMYIRIIKSDLGLKYRDS
ncbi:hypothetical protein [Bacillus wiedmannii]|nr:hypothetical protein [Bacillus wiedmannii]